jgi:hypothetical protein
LKPMIRENLGKGHPPATEQVSVRHHGRVGTVLLPVCSDQWVADIAPLGFWFRTKWNEILLAPLKEESRQREEWKDRSECPADIMRVDVQKGEYSQEVANRFHEHGSTWRRRHDRVQIVSAFVDCLSLRAGVMPGDHDNVE